MDKNFNCNNSVDSEYEKEYFDYELATFCGLYVETDLIKKIGLPEKDFFIWFDDTEYSIRILKYSKIRNINKAMLNHKTKLVANRGYNWKSYYSIRNQLFIIKKYFAKSVLIKFEFNIYLHILYSKIMSIFKDKKYYKSVASMYHNALKDGKQKKLGKNELYVPSNNDLFKKN
jgi:GT2 family glycosyltransferase